MSIKNRLKKGHMYSVVCAVFIVMLLAIVYLLKCTYFDRCETENNYRRSFSELTQYVSDIKMSLLKGRLISDKAEAMYLSSELYRQAEGAKANLGQLPFYDTNLENTSNFLSQVGNFSYSLSMRLLKGGEITNEEKETLKSLSSYASTLSDKLLEIEKDMYDGKYHFARESALSHLFGRGTVALANSMEEVEKEFHDYPSLIYDGPFSQHIDNQKPLFIENLPEISPEMSVSRAKVMYPNISFSFLGETGGNIPSYSVSGEIDGKKVLMEFTKQGGKLLWMLDNRKIEKKSISRDEAKKSALKFLEKLGFTNMKETYFEENDSSIIINYAYQENGYTFYGDLMKVKVALDNGDIVGFEARGYIAHHTQREIKKPKISIEQAKETIASGIDITDVNHSVIPLDSGREVACYELKGSLDDYNFLVYVNTETGYQEKVLILLEDENGTLAV